MAALPAAGPLLAAGVKALINYYEQRRTDQSLTEIAHDVGYLYRWEAFAWNVANDVFGAARGAEAISQGVSHDAGVKVEAIGHYVKDITKHTYNTVIPHSLSWLYGYTESHDLVPIRQRLGKVENTLRFLLGWRGQIDNWRNNYVDPQIQQSRLFRDWFNGWPKQVVTQWHSWFQQPSGFTDWATPKLIWPIIDYLQASDDQRARDALSLLMVDAWTEDPNLTWEAVLRWLVTDS